MAGFFLTASILLWWLRTFRRARRSVWDPRRVGVRLRDLAVPRARLHPPILMGSWGGGPLRIFPHLDWTAAFSIRLRQPLLQPVPRSRSRSSTVNAPLRDARRHRARPQHLGGEREIKPGSDRGTAARARRTLLALDDGLSTPRSVDPSLGVVVRGAVPARGRHRHPSSPERRSTTSFSGRWRLSALSTGSRTRPAPPTESPVFRPPCRAPQGRRRHLCKLLDAQVASGRRHRRRVQPTSTSDAETIRFTADRWSVRRLAVMQARRARGPTPASRQKRVNAVNLFLEVGGVQRGPDPRRDRSLPTRRRRCRSKPGLAIGDHQETRGASRERSANDVPAPLRLAPGGHWPSMRTERYRCSCTSRPRDDADHRPRSRAGGAAAGCTYCHAPQRDAGGNVVKDEGCVQADFNMHAPTALRSASRAADPDDVMRINGDWHAARETRRGHLLHLPPRKLPVLAEHLVR